MADQQNLDAIIKNPSISNAFNTISLLEDNYSEEDIAKGKQPKNLVKWQSYANQVVIESDDYFYKFYENQNDSNFPFFSEIRKNLALVYNELGIYWKVISFEKNGKIYDLEQRQKLKVVTENSWKFEDLLVSNGELLDKVEQMLGFEDILAQLKEANSMFANVSKLKLTRICLNNYYDYAIYNGKAILLDDADWSIALVDSNNEQINIQEDIRVPVSTPYGKFLFTRCASYMLEDGEAVLKLPNYDNIIHGWCMFTEPNTTNNSPNSADGEKAIVHVQDNDDADRELVQIQFSGLKRKIKSLVEYSKGTCASGEALKSEQKREQEHSIQSNAHSTLLKLELWKACNNSCLFCHLSEREKQTNSSAQLKRLENALSALDGLEANKIYNVFITGGEFFQGQLDNEDVRAKFYKLIEKLGKLYASSIIQSIHIQATLLKGNQSDLYKTLNLLENEGCAFLPHENSEGIFIETFWDAKGRFINEATKRNWDIHMDALHSYYPWVKKRATVTLSNEVCEMFISNSFGNKFFKYDSIYSYRLPNVHAISCVPGQTINPAQEQCDNQPLLLTENEFVAAKKAFNESAGFGYFPTRRIFRKFAMKCARQYPSVFAALFNKAKSNNKKATTCEAEDIRLVESNIIKETGVDDCNVGQKQCKHSLDFAIYSDINECAACDISRICRSMQEG